MIKINFENTYEPHEIAGDLSFMTFTSLDKKGKEIVLKVEIKTLGDPLLPNVFNLAFGPPILGTGNINDKAKINHSDINKMFSTVLFFALFFLQANPNKTIGIDGSDDVRAYLYHRMFLSNRELLNEYFVTIGVDWYVRLLRNGNIEVDVNGFPFFKPRPEPFDYLRRSTDLYRYYMFNLWQ